MLVVKPRMVVVKRRHATAIKEPRPQSPLFVKTYDFLLWLIPLTLKFPKSQRFLPAVWQESPRFGPAERPTLRYHQAL